MQIAAATSELTIATISRTMKRVGMIGRSRLMRCRSRSDQFDCDMERRQQLPNEVTLQLLRDQRDLGAQLCQIRRSKPDLERRVW